MSVFRTIVHLMNSALSCRTGFASAQLSVVCLLVTGAV